MSDTMPSSSEWVQFYQQTIAGGQSAPPSSGLSDATMITTSVTSDSMLSPSNSSTTSGHLSPKGCASKPIRRRPRASRRTPTTLLNADTTNFRALVQQFTGCPRPPASFGTPRGPLNLNFGRGSDQQNQLNATSIMAPLGYSYYNQQSQPQQQRQEEEEQQQFYQEQQRMVSLDNINSDVFLSTFSNPRPNMQAFDGFSAENMNLHEFSRDSSSNGNRNDDYFL